MKSFVANIERKCRESCKQLWSVCGREMFGADTLDVLLCMWLSSQVRIVNQSLIIEASVVVITSRCHAIWTLLKYLNGLPRSTAFRLISAISFGSNAWNFSITLECNLPKSRRKLTASMYACVCVWECVHTCLGIFAYVFCTRSLPGASVCLSNRQLASFPLLLSLPLSHPLFLCLFVYLSPFGICHSPTFVIANLMPALASIAAAAQETVHISFANATNITHTPWVTDRQCTSYWYLLSF